MLQKAIPCVIIFVLFASNAVFCLSQKLNPSLGIMHVNTHMGYSEKALAIWHQDVV